MQNESFICEQIGWIQFLTDLWYGTFVDGKFQVQPKSKYYFLLILVFRVYRS